MNVWHCQKGFAPEGAMCSHLECKPKPEERGSTLAHGMRSKEKPYATLGEAQDSLIHALEVMRTIHEDIASRRQKIAEQEELIREREDELRQWSAVAKEALAPVAMGFHMTVKDDNG
ncbi:hypothetical protein ACIP79_00650 [Streptomyces sp. NPDC088747]|uniref:hypothetical protein n=1 Tax=Streptomyces sp. NPDC088747 TaxID=3365886 RepID=UPI00380F47D0